jgi:hypothetical protein
MKTLFDTIKISYSEYMYFNELKPKDKINYLFELFEVALNNNSDLDLPSRLQDFFNSLQHQLENEDIPDYDMDLSYLETSEEQFPDDVELVDVMIDDNHLMVETNSLKALRYTIYKFIELGYILERDIDTEKMFRPSKITKYIRIFRIIDQVSSLCLN